MNRFIPKEKMGKRERRKLDKIKRVTWEGVRPVTRTVESKKNYDRKKSPRPFDCDGTGVLLIMEYYQFPRRVKRQSARK
jgi:hypothetical protein